MDDVLCQEVPSGGPSRIFRGDETMVPYPGDRFLLDDRSTPGKDRPGNPGTVPQIFIGCIDDGLGLLLRDIPLNQL